jgi:cytochrome c oxidase assembly factor CtaG
MVHSYWDLDPTVIGGTILLVLGYILYVGPLRRRFHLGPAVPLLRQMAFHLGCLVMLLALVSPLDGLGDEYLLSAHMAQHMLLGFIAPPLWLIGTPDWLVKLILPPGYPERLANPVFAFVMFNGVFWVWHLPRFYDAALENDSLHVVEHIMFMVGGVLGWAPLIGSGFTDRQSLSTKFIYLVPSMFSCNALAALITLSPKPLFPFYGQAALHFGLTTIEDQYLAGLCMWLPGDMLYLAFFLWIFKSMFDGKQSEWKVTG